MANIAIEIPEELKEDFIKSAQQMQDKYYSAQLAESNPETKQQYINNFMSLADIINKLTLWK